MPPHVSRKRARSPSPAPRPSSNNKATGKTPTKRAKPTLFETADAPAKRRKTLEDKKNLLDELNADDDDDLVSEADSDDFEDVPAAKRRKTAKEQDGNDGEDADESEEEDDGMDWEDVAQNHSSAQPTPGPSTEHEIADVSFSLKDDGGVVDEGVRIPGLKKGPTKKEKAARYYSHCLHVQALLWHNTVRNGWLNDKGVQKMLVKGLPEGVKREVVRWREAMGTSSKEELKAKKDAATAQARSKKGRKGKDKGHGRDWNHGAEHAEQGVPNMSAGDPLLRLLKVLTAYWRKRFTITAPGLRKQGYMSIKRMRDEIKHWQANKTDMEEHGERIENIDQLRHCAEECEGSRDVGAQLFAALLRSLGLETRLVANLQPVGLGFSKAEEANAKKLKSKATQAAKGEAMSDSDVAVITPKKASAKKAKSSKKQDRPARKSIRGNQTKPINIDDSDSPLSDAPSDAGVAAVDEDDEISLIDITPATMKRKPNKKYDRELAFPNYWVEVCSPISHKYIPVDPIVLSTIASNDDLLQTFEPRGKKAEIGKQVMAYTIAFSSDGSAKDVTVRYLRKHQLPGKTKGMRLPAEKRPVYNKKGKVKRYEEYDWFRTVMSHYDRPENKRTAADDLEEQTDLRPQKPEKQEKEVEKESLQWYKQSAEFILEQHLRREEAILPDSESVKTFTAGKGDKAKEFPVFLREDVVTCKTVESWHKEGRALKKGQHPMKIVPMRAVTLIRKREMEDALRETGEKLKQGLYSWDQTDWIIPDPIKDGVIPKNAFGNMDVYMPTMVPKGAVHVPLKGTAKLCRRLEIDYAEACTGFEFGKQRAVPVLTGVVVADEHEILVRDAWKVEQEEVKRKEDTKRTAAALQWWRKMLLGLRVLERMRIDYADSGGKEEEMNPFVMKAKREGKSVASKSKAAPEDAVEDDDQGGGFFLPGHDEEEVPQTRAKADAQIDDMEGGGFMAVSEDEEMHAPADDGLLIEDRMEIDHKQPPQNHAPITPTSLQSLHTTAGDDDDMDDREDIAEPAKLPIKRNPTETKHNTVKPRPQQTSKRQSNQKHVVKDEEESELSDLESSSDARDGSDDDDDEVKSTPFSPRVVLLSSKTTPKTRARQPKKATPLKSQYFAASESDAPEGEEDDADDDDDESEEEVVQPSRTTKRTRGTT
ncbi:hypothetical protein LTR78_001663 [Recurvomyces mirabilis]|uniref:Rad4-domain-containing protein n=1 Tax=Recurvomyces mirabilis TaxID=574656 RepID=A0AAE1C550_9PEZI|nr:hypothetical protein LTR78_001663 [Recurvomyces mirabilis]KAK5151767.1 hypothetical protein LTS14_008899 [Recurvomyces mirabilis]